MDGTVGLLLATFLTSFVALIVFIASMARGLFGGGSAAAQQIFEQHERGQVEDPTLDAAGARALQQAVDPGVPVIDPERDAEIAERQRIDRSSAGPALLCLTLAIVWLVWGSVAGLMSSIKLHAPSAASAPRT